MRTGYEGLCQQRLSKCCAPGRKAGVQCSRGTEHPYHLGNLSEAKFPDTSPGLDSLTVSPGLLTLLRVPRRLLMPVISDSFTVEKTSEASGLDRHGCGSHMTLDRSLLLSQPQVSHPYKEVTPPPQGHWGSDGKRLAQCLAHSECPHVIVHGTVHCVL